MEMVCGRMGKVATVWELPPDEHDLALAERFAHTNRSVYVLRGFHQLPHNLPVDDFQGTVSREERFATLISCLRQLRLAAGNSRIVAVSLTRRSAR